MPRFMTMQTPTIPTCDGTDSMKRNFRNRALAHSRHQRGVGLVEVLISVLILGIGMLGVAAMQATALRYGQSSLETSQAVMQTYSIIESMRANPGNAPAYATAGMVCAVPAAGGSLASKDIAAWITSLKNTMGLAADNTTCGRVENRGGGVYRITVRWDDSRARDGSNQRDLVIETAI